MTMIPTVFRFAERLEWLGSRLQGKGYATSVPFEVKLASRFMSGQPSLVVDVGGNVGDYSFEITRRYPESKIWIFEPAPKNVERLRARFAAMPGVTVVPLGLSDHEDEVTFYSDVPGSGNASLYYRDGHDPRHTIRVSVIPFERFWTTSLGRRPIDLLKMDIEGHELQALNGFGEALAATRLLQFEFGRCNLAARTSWADFFRFFRSAGFDLYRYSPLGLQPVSTYLETDEYFLHANFLAVNRRAENA